MRGLAQRSPYELARQSLPTLSVLHQTPSSRHINYESAYMDRGGRSPSHGREDIMSPSATLSATRTGTSIESPLPAEVLVKKVVVPIHGALSSSTDVFHQSSVIDNVCSSNNDLKVMRVSVKVDKSGPPYSNCACKPNHEEYHGSSSNAYPSETNNHREVRLVRRLRPVQVMPAMTAD